MSVTLLQRAQQIIAEDRLSALIEVREIDDWAEGADGQVVNAVEINGEYLVYETNGSLIVAEVRHFPGGRQVAPETIEKEICALPLNSWDYALETALRHALLRYLDRQNATRRTPAENA